MNTNSKMRYVNETETDRVRRGKRKLQMVCAFLLPTELAGLTYLLNYVFAM